ncbi:MAG: type I-A CRISPR-associated protein Cas5a [bacterium]|nr:type I-A CRISPR-associated protein Cas5a [bacterium]
MKALSFELVLNSLYSIRIPFTWQSALTYPILPPSAVIGMIANAMQRYENKKHPEEYLTLLEKEILWAGSRLLTPCVVKSYITSAIVKWADTIGSRKFTNALTRQFAFATNIEVVVIFKSSSPTEEIYQAIKTVPLTCGDSESCVSVERNLTILEATEKKVAPGDEIETYFPVPLDTNLYEFQGSGKIFLVHERCKKTEKNFPLEMYIFPLLEKQGLMFPEKVVLKVKKDIKVYSINQVIVVPQKNLLR